MSKHRSRKHRKVIDTISKNENKTTEVFVEEDFRNTRDIKEDIKEDMKEDIKEDAKQGTKEEQNESNFEIKNQKCVDDIKGCETSLLNYKTITFCKNEPIIPTHPSKSVLVKIPVIISKFVLNVNCDVELKFKDPVFEIKNSKENVYLTHCKLIPKAHRLFFGGYLRKSIEYSTVKLKKKRGKQRIVNQLTVYIPFEGVTEVSYSTPPVLDNLEDKKEIICYCNDYGLGIESNERTYRYSESLNEKIICELLRADIFESEIIEDRSSSDIETFNKIEEKVVLYLTLRLLQNQEIAIN